METNRPSRLVASPPQGFLRWILRVPLWLYRGHLGWLLGNRFLVLTHQGRKTGLPHQTVVEVVSHNPISRGYVIASGWGSKADWFQNIQNTPQVKVQVGCHQFEAMAEQLPVEAAAHELYRYAREHHLAFRELQRVLTGRTTDGSTAACQELAQRIPLIILLARVPHS